MTVCGQLAQHLRAVHHGGNWTGVSLGPLLADVTWEEATVRTGSFNTIAALTFHINYYARAIRAVLEGGPLEAHDKFSYDVPPVENAAGWEALRAQATADAEAVATLLDAFPDERLNDAFAGEKYGSNLRNFLGLIEHTHYHLGQIALLKKGLRTAAHPVGKQSETGNAAPLQAP